VLSLLVVTTALAASPTDAQQSGRTFGLTLSHSVASAAAAHGSVCPCVHETDVLAPVSVTTMEVELAFPLAAGERWGLDYPLRLVPITLVRNNPAEPARMLGSGRWTMSLETPRASTAGLGAKPIGLRGWVGARRVRLEADASAGVIHFGMPLLASNATRLNFAYDFAVGLGIALPGGGRALVGYRYHHMTNAGLGDVNPGLDSHAAYLGFRIH
jgi:hypothetical protein